MLRPLTLEDVTWTIIAEPDDLPVRGNAMASGDDAYDKQVENRIIKRAQTNVWAWAVVEVRGTYRGLKASDYLGCCSYRNEKDFVKNSGYYDDMRDRVLSELNAAIHDIVQGLTVEDGVAHEPNAERDHAGHRQVP